MTMEREIRDAAKEGKLVIGTGMVVRNIKKDAIKYVICPENCSDDVLADLGYYGRNFGVEIRKFSGDSRQLGEICGKPFNVMLLGVKK